MIDGISGGGGPVRGPFGQRPAETTEPVRAARPAAQGQKATGTGASALVRDLAAAPPVDAGRVADLRARIAAGTYRLDPQRIAAAMLALDRGRP